MLFTLVFLYNEKTRHDRSHAAFKMRYCFLIHPVRKAKALFCAFSRCQDFRCSCCSTEASAWMAPYRFLALHPARPPPAQAHAQAQAQLLAQAQWPPPPKPPPPKPPPRLPPPKPLLRGGAGRCFVPTLPGRGLPSGPRGYHRPPTYTYLVPKPAR